MRRAVSTPGSSKGAYKSGRGRTAALQKKKKKIADPLEKQAFHPAGHDFH